MLADCSLTPLAMSTKVDTLKIVRLRLCHVNEWEIYKQIKSIKTEVVEKEGMFSAMFSRAKCTHYATLAPFEGDIPFKPHRMLGFSPCLSLRVPSASTEWSDAVDLIKADFDSSELAITTSSRAGFVTTGSVSGRTINAKAMAAAASAMMAANAPSSVFYEFGAYIERGRGFLQNITTVTLVPKHIVVSKLSMPIQIKQIFPSTECEPLTLQPGSLCSYHFPSRSKSKLLHIRRGSQVLQADGTASGNEGDWQAEIDICKLGVLYAKLRDPLQIIKVQIDTVGASMVATLTEQSTLWPPYRIDNMTEMEIRFRQITSPGAAGAAFGQFSGPSPVGGMLSRKNTVVEGAVKKAAGEVDSDVPITAATATQQSLGTEDSAGGKSTTSSTAGGSSVVPWDYLEKQNSAPYAWDLPFSGRKTIQLEVRQLSTSWVPCEVNLDDNDKLPPLIVKKAAPSLGNPFAEGFLLKQDATGDNWTKVYCILRPDVLYIYPDESRDYLLDVINLSHGATTSTATVSGEAAQFAFVSRFVDKKWMGSTMGYFMSSTAAAKSKAVDINKARCMILKLAEGMGLFANVTELSFRKETSDSESDGGGGGGGEGDSAKERISTASQSTYSPSKRLSSTASADLISESLAKVTFDVGAAEDSTERKDSVDALEDRDTFSDMPNTGGRECNDLQIDETSSSPSRESIASVRRARFSSAPGSTLLSLLTAGVSTEELLEEASNIPLRAMDVVEALLTTKYVDRLDKAKEMCEWMLSEGLLKPRTASKAIDGSGGGVAMFGDDLENGDADADHDSDVDPEELGDRFTIAEPLKISASPSAAGLCEAAVVASSAPSSRLSMSKQVSRTLSTRLSVSGDDTSAAAAEVAGSHRSIAMSMSRRKQSLLKRYADVDLFMCPPTLNPEMMAMLDQANRDSDAQSNPASSSAGVGSNTAVDSNEVFGFTIAMEAKKYNFKCSSEMEFFGWIQACRQSIELLWVDHFLGRRADKKAVALEDYQASIILRLRADGSTKVLEVMQDDERIAKEVKKKNPRRSGKNARQSVSSSQAFSRLSKAIRNSHLAPSLVSEVELKEFNPDKELISVLFTVQSVALSIINAEPAEMLYLSLSGIEMTVERSIDLVKFSVTVQEIQLSNQLLNPEFPVALFPRRIREGQARRLMLPGLNPDRKTYPSLHLYIQQRYHTSLSDVANPGAADSFEEDSHLHYFEMFSLWISPMQLDVDEEIIVKCIRYIRGLKDVVYNPNLGRVGTEFTEELISLQQLGSKSWEGQINRRAVFELYMKLLDSGKEPYLTYNPSAKSSSGIYLSLLQLHPIDLVMSFRPSPNLTVTNSELAMISIISQLDSARLCLNALIAEHAFGSPAIIGEVLLKHYKNAFWRQFHKLIGASDLVEGSVGLVANLGSGVYDLFYEPIDGLMDENGSFLNGLSKGGISLASRTIGGTSAFTSQITGGLGKGVSLLTLDSQFQRNRAYRRFNKTSSMSEGIYVGTQELGKNIVEGVTGIVVSPYRGWETGGGVGFGMGIAKGILGVALKPAVGVFDLASRATEGLRNTAFSGDPDLLDDRFGTFRKRIPRAFGRNGQIALYDAKAAAAQYVADHMTFFQPDPRMLVVHHLYIRRKLEKFTVPGLQVPDEVAEIEVPKSEAWGFPLNKTYLVLVGHNRITLAELSSPEKANSSKKGIKKRASRPRKFIWSCPANCIDQLFSDPHGDLILSISNSALISGAWNSPVPTVLDNLSQNFLIFQSLLEQTIGFKRARKQPLNPTEGLIQSDIRKRYSSGIKSYLMSPSNHTYRLNGHVLYEYSDSNSKKQAMKAEANSTASAEGLESSEKIAGSAGPVDTVDTATTKSEYYIDQLISRIFPTDTPSSTTNINNSTTTAAAKAKLPGEAVLDDMYMSFIYPLVGLYIAGPTAEEGGKFFSITLSRLDGQKMRVLKADEDQEHLSEYLKTNLSLIFAKAEDAQHWRRNLEDAMLWNIEEDEVVEAGPLTTEERRKQSRTIMAMARGAEEVIPPPDDSILGMLVLPTSGCKAEQTEMIKIEIAKTLSATRWR